MKKVLLVEDDPHIAELLRLHLTDLSCELVATGSGQEGITKATTQPFHLIILDVMLPDVNGLEVCRQIRAKQTTTPILMLTAKSEEIDKVLGLELGADDYLTKPFGIHEFTARVKALFRRNELTYRPETEVRKPIQYDNLVIDAEKHSVLANNQRVELTPKEFDLLWLLVSHPGRSYSRKELLSQVWGYEFDGYEHTVTAHINRLRTKIEPDFSHPVYILTTWGIGYRFADMSD